MNRSSRFVHYGTIAAGVLVAALCGLCTFNVATSPDNAMIAPVAWIVGGAPTLFGLWLIVHSVQRLWSGDGK
jgi:hypothetical protein